MSNLPSVKMAPERVAQLKQMAANMDAVNMSEVLAKLISFAQNEGLIAHEIPGVKINTFSNGLAIKFDDSKTVEFSFADAARLSDEIRAYLAGERENKKVISMTDTQGAKFTLIGKGQGVSIAIPAFSKTPKVFDRGLAGEFARLIDLEIAKTA